MIGIGVHTRANTVLNIGRIRPHNRQAIGRQRLRVRIAGAQDFRTRQRAAPIVRTEAFQLFHKRRGVLHVIVVDQTQNMRAQLFQVPWISHDGLSGRDTNHRAEMCDPPYGR